MVEISSQAVLNNPTLVVLAVIPLACLLAFYFAIMRAIRRSADQLRREFEERLDVVTLKARPKQPSPPPAEPVVTGGPVATAPRASQVSAPVPEPPKPVAEEVSPEMILVMAAAVTAYLGKAVRIRSARLLYSHESFNAWSQQGRAVIQASHNLAQRSY